jgi:hypothetical protein
MGNKIQDFRSGVQIKCNPDGTVSIGNKNWKFITSAITANSTTTSLAAGTFGSTSHATGRDKIFVSDGSKWQNFSPGSSIADAVADQAALTAAALTGTLTGTANGSLADVAATAGSCAGSAEPSAANVDSAIATAVASIVTGVNEQNKEMQAQINALIVDVAAARTKLNAALASLRAAGQMTA